jgi:cytochrome c oxidase assembly protein subunit 15
MESVAAPLRALAWAACAFAFCVIVFGSFVRLSNAGLSCPDWPTCYGRVTWPVKPAAVAKADKAFPDRPVEKHRAWREQVHRFLAGTLGLLVLAEALAATFLGKRRFALVIAAVVLIGVGIPLYMARDYVASSAVAAVGEALLLGTALFWRSGGWRRIAVLALAVVCFQALLGMWTVTWLLLPLVVTAHLLGGMLTFGLLAWLACQIFLGGWTSTNYAALACGIGGAAFPQCLAQWWPAMDFHEGFILWRHIGVDFQGGILDASARTAIQMVHRIGAAVVFVYVLWLAHRAGRAGLRRYGVALAVLLLAQVALGIGNVTLGQPLWIAVAHTGGAALLLFALVGLLVQAQFERSSLITASPKRAATANVFEAMNTRTALLP